MSGADARDAERSVARVVGEDVRRRAVPVARPAGYAGAIRLPSATV